MGLLPTASDLSVCIVPTPMVPAAFPGGLGHTLEPRCPADQLPFSPQNTLEQCNVCHKPIMERILRATGKAYHPHCFTCVMCHRSLDGIPFTVDACGLIHCIEDFHK